jgi:hypothetical protein
MQVIKLKHFTDCIFKKINFCYYENVYNMERSFMPDTMVFILVSLYMCMCVYVCMCVCVCVCTCAHMWERVRMCMIYMSMVNTF